MTRLVQAALAAFFVALCSWPAWSGFATAPPGNCGDYRRIKEILGDKYGESLLATGDGPSGSIELWVSEARTWTLLIKQDDFACLLAAGNGIRFSNPLRTKGREA
jgi:hypothetical protein